jgi:hypothetical protein
METFCRRRADEKLADCGEEGQHSGGLAEADACMSKTGWLKNGVGTQARVEEHERRATPSTRAVGTEICFLGERLREAC